MKQCRFLHALTSLLLLLLLTMPLPAAAEGETSSSDTPSSPEGPLIQDILLEGLARTRPTLVRESLPFQEGDIYTPEAGEESLQKLRNLKLFRSVELEVMDHPRGVTLKYTFQDPWTLIPYLLPGYNSNKGFSLMGGLIDTNLMGLGNSLITNASLLWDTGGHLSQWTLFGLGLFRLQSQPRNRYILSSLFKKEEDLLTFMASLGMDRELDGNLTGGFRLDGGVEKESGGQRIFAGPALSVGWDNRQFTEGNLTIEGYKVELTNGLYPTRGKTWQLRDHLNLKGLAGWKLHPRLNWITRLQYRYYGGDSLLWGGDGFIRGFSQADISGNHGVVLNNELRLLAYRNKGIGRFAAALILDSGYVGTDLVPASFQWNYSGGAGFKYYPSFLGGLIFRADVVWPLSGGIRAPEVIITLVEMIQ